MVKKDELEKAIWFCEYIKGNTAKPMQAPFKTMIRKTEKRILALPPKINKSFLNIDQIKNGE